MPPRPCGRPSWGVVAGVWSWLRPLVPGQQGDQVGEFIGGEVREERGPPSSRQTDQGGNQREERRTGRNLGDLWRFCNFRAIWACFPLKFDSPWGYFSPRVRHAASPWLRRATVGRRAPVPAPRRQDSTPSARVAGPAPSAGFAPTRMPPGLTRNELRLFPRVAGVRRLLPGTANPPCPAGLSARMEKRGSLRAGVPEAGDHLPEQLREGAAARMGPRTNCWKYPLQNPGDRFRIGAAGWGRASSYIPLGRWS